MSEELTRLNNAILSCTLPSSGDGISNAERAEFVCHTFKAQIIDLNRKMPYEAMLKSNDPERILASIHLAKLQFQYAQASHHAGFLERERMEFYTAYLHLMIGKLAWHKKHVEAGKKTPPFGFVN